MKILIACEESQAITIEMRKLGLEAYSCDIQECSGGHPEWHIQGDAIVEAYSGKYDMVLGFPPCTYLTNAGMCNMTRKNSTDEYRVNRIRLRDEAYNFFMKLYNCPAKYVALENPVGYVNSHFRKPDQIIYPYNFGHRVNKRTCLWVKGLPLLKNTDTVDKDEITIWEGTGKKISKWYKNTLKEGKGDLKLVSKLRSKTFPGIAKAIAEQWGLFITK